MAKKNKKSADVEPTKKGKGPSVVADFTNVKSGGGAVKVPENDYKVRVAKIEQKESQAGNTMLLVHFEILEGKYKGKVLRENFPLTENALWKLRNFLEAIDKKVPKKKVRLHYAEWKDEELAITTEDDTYENKSGKEVPVSRVADFMTLEDFESEDEDEDEDTDDDDDDEDEDELEEVDLDAI